MRRAIRRNPYIRYWRLLERAVTDTVRKSDQHSLRVMIRRLGISKEAFRDDCEWLENELQVEAHSPWPVYGSTPTLPLRFFETIH